MLLGSQTCDPPLPAAKHRPPCSVPKQPQQLHLPVECKVVGDPAQAGADAAGPVVLEHNEVLPPGALPRHLPAKRGGSGRGHAIDQLGELHTWVLLQALHSCTAARNLHH